MYGHMLLVKLTTAILMPCSTQSILGGQYIGTIDLPASGSDKTETCFEMVGSSPNLQPAIYLGVIRFTRLESWQPVAVAAAASGNAQNSQNSKPAAARVRPGSIPPPASMRRVSAASLPVLKPNRPGAAPVAVPAPGLDMNSGEMRWLVGIQDKEAAAARAAKNGSKQGKKPVEKKPAHAAGKAAAAGGARKVAQKPQAAAAAVRSIGSRQQQAIGPPGARSSVRVTPRMQQAEQEAVAAAVRSAAGWRQADDSSRVDVSVRWRQVRLQHLWPDGQTRLESMYSPYHSEGIELCQECQPQL
jgi:hypothetical protein